MDDLVDVANSAPEESRDEALSALRGAVLEWAFVYRGGATENQFKASEVFAIICLTLCLEPSKAHLCYDFP